MTTPTNWPNPERPGVPLFPERDGWHVLQYYVVRNGKEMPMGDPVLSWWEAKLSVWNLKPEGQIFAPPEQVAADTVKYAAITVSPAQISEMLAAERERCAEICESLAPRQGYSILGNIGDSLEYAAKAIRNLGAAV